MTKRAIVALILACLFCWAPAHASSSSQIVVNGKPYASWTAYFLSDEFRLGGLRCGTKDPFAAKGDRAQESLVPGDCSMESTNPTNDYVPDRVWEVTVVVHRLESATGQGVFPDALVASQIDVMNEDFRALPGTPGEPGTDTRIQFKLATEDPNGDPHPGFTRTVNEFWFNDQLDPLNGTYWDALAWDPTRYLNIYTMSPVAPGGVVLGYVQYFPQEGAGLQDDGVRCLWNSTARRRDSKKGAPQRMRVNDALQQAGRGFAERSHRPPFTTFGQDPRHSVVESEPSKPTYHLCGAHPMHRARTTFLALATSGWLIGPSLASAQWPPDGAPVCVLTPAMQRIGEIVSDGAGGAYVSFIDGRNGEDWDVYVQRITASGAIAPGWPATGVPVCMEPGDQYAMGLTADSEGGAIVVWEDYRTWVNPDPFTHSRDIYALKVTSSGAIAAGWQVNGTPAATLYANRRRARIASDGAGGAFVAWEDERNGSWDVYALRLTADGARAGGWLQDGLRLSDLFIEKGPVHILADDSGGAFFVWGESTDISYGGTIRALRLTAAGEVAPGWQANGKTLCTEPCKAGVSGIASDGAGGAYVAFVDIRTWPGSPADFVFYTDVYAQHITGTGEIVAGWPSDGLVVTAIPQEVQWNVEVVADGAGGALLGWEDYRDVVAAPYVQRLTASGALAPGWTPDGVRATNSAAYGLGPRIAPDGSGGAYIAFELLIGSYYRLYAQHLTGIGVRAPGWGAEGTPLAAGTPWDQGGPRIASDGVGGAIVAWQDSRIVSDPDIYAQRLTMDGPVPVLVSLVSAEVEQGRVTLTWFAGEGPGFLGAVERRTAESDWRHLASITGDGTGRLVYQDRAVAPGTRYAYRLSYDEGSGPVATPEVWVDVPAQATFALHGLRPHPAVRDLVASFSLASDAPATLELFDLSGRRLLGHEVGSLGPGDHRVDLARGQRLPAGVYSLRLTQGERRATVRAVVIR